MLLIVLGAGVVKGFDGPYGPWQDQDIGLTGAQGFGAYSNGTFTITGAGADICCSADAFNFAYVNWTGDCAFAIRITSVTNVDTTVATDSFARLGIMFRASTNASAPYAYILWRAGGITAFQARDSGGENLWTNGSWVSLSYWVKLVRQGNTFSSFDSEDGTNWTLIDSTNIAMPETFLVGLAVTSHSYGTPCVANCDHLQIESPPLTPNVTVLRAFNGNILSWTEASANTTGFAIKGCWDTNGYWESLSEIDVGANVTNYVDWFVDFVAYRVQALGALANSAFSAPVMAKSGVLDPIPAPWQSADVGAVGVPGSDNYSNAVFRIGGSGVGIGGTNDEFHFVYQTLRGDGDVTGTFGPSDNYINYTAKMGLMIRQSLADDSPYAFLYLLDGGFAADFRKNPGANAITNSPSGGYINGFRLTRRGNQLAAYVTDVYGNGIPRTLASEQIQVTGPVYVGMAVTSTDNRYLQVSDFSVDIIPAGGKLGITRMANGTLDVSLEGELNANYGIDASTNLAQWTRLMYVFNSGPPITLQYSINTNLPRQFFRSVLLH